MIPAEIRDNPKLLRLHRSIAAKARNWQAQTQEQADSLLIWIDLAIAEWASSERRRRKARKRCRVLRR